MSTSKDKVEFKMLDHQRVGDEYVTFKLEDGTIVKVKVDLDRVGIATNYVNSDGTPHYAVNASLKLSIIPNERKFFVAHDAVKSKSTSPPSQMFS